MRLDNKLNGSAAKGICSLSERATIIAFNEAKAVREVRLRGSPIARLVDSGRIGGDELRAAQDIESAFMAISGGLFMKPLNMERVDGGRGNPDWPHALAKIVGQYQDWANFWSDRRKQHLDIWRKCAGERGHAIDEERCAHHRQPPKWRTLHGYH